MVNPVGKDGYGKGSVYRHLSKKERERYERNYDMIFGEKKPIKDWPGYWIYKDGRVWSDGNKSNHREGKFLKPCLVKGHFGVNLYKNGKSFYKSVSCLVLEAFVGPCPEGMEACHNDGNPSNNNLNNLRWDTHSNNMKDSIKHGTCAGFRCGEKSNSAKLIEQNVKEIRKLYKSKELNQYQLAIKFNTSQSNISHIINRKTWNT